jgi:NAD-dependent dihydropyrimidine dehydrogenase PreA subunit
VGVFIEITFDERQISPALATRLVALCPVDIYAVEGGRLVVRPEAEDECTLCELCLSPAPAGALVIHKRYNGERLVSRGAAPTGA